jgi:hypothetical protein
MTGMFRGFELKYGMEHAAMRSYSTCGAGCGRTFPFEVNVRRTLVHGTLRAGVFALFTMLLATLDACRAAFILLAVVALCWCKRSWFGHFLGTR